MIVEIIGYFAIAVVMISFMRFIFTTKGDEGVCLSAIGTALIAAAICFK